jgi:IstB-like ATP binding protein
VRHAKGRKELLAVPFRSNEHMRAPHEWGRFLPEQTTAVNILDRLLHHATVVITDGQSYRMKDAQHRKENPQPT